MNVQFGVSHSFCNIVVTLISDSPFSYPVYSYRTQTVGFYHRCSPSLSNCFISRILQQGLIAYCTIAVAYKYLLVSRFRLPAKL